jgi:hypothetical protein
MPAIGLRQLSTIIGLAAGLTELFLALTAVAMTGKSADYVGMFIYIIPFIMMLGAVLVSVKHETYLGAGIMVVAFAMQHVLDPIRGVYILPMLLVMAAVALALKVDHDLRGESAAASGT